MGAPAFAATRFVRSALRSIVVCLSIIVISMMTMAKPAHASGTLSTPPSLLYSVSVWAYCIPGTIVSYPNPSCTMQNVAISCSASSWAGLAPCVTAAAGGPVAINNYFGNYVGGNPFGSTNPVTSHIGCPDHAQVTGNTCTCTDPYVPEEPDRTRCVLEQYTLYLKTDPPEKIEPSGSATVTATVYDAQGRLKDGVTVSIKVDVEAGTGGHGHDAGRHVSPYTGTMNPTTGTTGSDGTFSFTFDAPEVSGTHTFAAKCVSPTCTNSPATAKIDVKVDGLLAMQGSDVYEFVGAVPGVHADNHYLTPVAMYKLVTLATDYHKSFPTSPVLRVNDASLKWGGKFDVFGNWAGDHAEHRRGTVIDIRANSSPGAIPPENFKEFKKQAAFYGTDAKIHHPGQDTQHFHVRLLNREE